MKPACLLLQKRNAAFARHRSAGAEKASTAQEAIMMDQILFWGGLAAAAIICIAGAVFMTVWALRWKNLQFALEREYGLRPSKK